MQWKTLAVPFSGTFRSVKGGGVVLPMAGVCVVGVEVLRLEEGEEVLLGEEVR